MKKLTAFLTASFFALSVPSYAYKEVFNPHTGRLDKVGATASSDIGLVCDSGQVLVTTGGGSWACGTSGGSGSGDMTKAVYDSQNSGHITGLTLSGGTGGVLNMDGTANTAGSITTTSTNSGLGGNITTAAGGGANTPGGNINTSGGAGSGGGDINTSGGAGGSPSGLGGSINTSGNVSPGGSIDTHGGGGSINTTGLGSIQFGISGNRTTLSGTASVDRAISLPDAAGTLGFGDMLKSIYDPQNAGYISGANNGSGVGGLLKLDAAFNMDGGSIDTRASSSYVGGSINTSASNGGTGGSITTTSSSAGAGGNINTSGGSDRAGGSINTYNGGSINTSAGAAQLSGGSIDTHEGGGSINTRGTGSIELGTAGTRTTFTGTASTDRAIALPDASGTVLLNDGDGSNLNNMPEAIGLAASDETTDLVTGTAVVSFHMPYAMTLTNVRATVGTAPAGATIIVDIKENGTTVLSTLITIDAGETSSVTAAPPVISDSALADDSTMTVDITQVGSGTPGKGLKIWIQGIRP